MLSRCQLPSYYVSKAASTPLLDIRMVSNSLNLNMPSSSFRSSSMHRRPFTSSRPSPSSSSSESLFSRRPLHSILPEDVDSQITSQQGASKTQASPAPKPRQAMTKRESKVLTDMLDMIFTPGAQNTSPGTNSHQTRSEDAVGPIHVNDLFGRLRRLSTKRPTSKARAATSELFDMKKEEMNKCESDQELLEWAAREVFDESVRYEKAARRAAEIAAQSPDSSTKKTRLPLQSPIYPQMIAYLMRTFREQYRDPNLALYIFNYTQKLSVVSYTFGCSTDAYNEVIEIRWSYFKDAKGVLDALIEMETNAVPINNRTHALVDQMRRDIGKDVILGQNNNAKLLAEVEETLARIANVKKAKGLGAWKKSISNEDDDDGFDDWSKLDLMTFTPTKTNRRHARI